MDDEIPGRICDIPGGEWRELYYAAEPNSPQVLFDDGGGRPLLGPRGQVLRVVNQPVGFVRRQ